MINPALGNTSQNKISGKKNPALVDKSHQSIRSRRVLLYWFQDFHALNPIYLFGEASMFHV